MRVNGIAVDATHVYVATGHWRDGKVLKVAKTGGPVTTLATGLNFPKAVAVDNDFVYWVHGTSDWSSRVPDANAVMRIAK